MDKIIDYLSYYARISPVKTAFIICGNGEEPDVLVSYADLDRYVRLQAIQLSALDLHGKRVILFYQDVLSFIIAFLGCQYAGIIPVPVPYVQGNKHFSKLQHIIDDAAPSAILCRKTSDRHLQQAGILLIHTDVIPLSDADLSPTPHNIAFIQYTSGSTDKPKGVVITHKNLISNQQLIRHTFHCNTDAVIFSWLPFHHDMGLIGNILHAIFTGCTCVLMPPADFIQQPQRWLEGISRYKATHSGGPDFAYNLCVDKISVEKLHEIDLSHWKVAYNGSEVVRPSTLDRFADHFAAVGFNMDAFYPCYGLAEATLLVAGRSGEMPAVIMHKGKQLISAGPVVEGIDIKIISTDTQQLCSEFEEGEICISGESITDGYWKKDNAAYFYDLEGKRFLRTGDLGFLNHGQLFIQGRIKEMLIVRGKNIYPNDIEQAVMEVIDSIDGSGVAVFAIDSLQEQIVLVAEIKRTVIKTIDIKNVIYSIEKIVSGRFGVGLYDIVLTSPFSIPRTTSGKLQRTKCSDWYRNNTFRITGSKRQHSAQTTRPEVNGLLLQKALDIPDYTHLRNYLLHLVEIKTGIPVNNTTTEYTELTDLGIDSLQFMELVNTVNKELDLNINTVTALENNTISAFAGLLENMLWLKNKLNSDNEVII